MPRPSVALRVLVVNDAPLAEAIQRLRGEWTELSGGILSATSVSWEEFPKNESSESLPADVLVFPARYLGEFCERGMLRPVRVTVLSGDGYQADDVFPVVSQWLVQYGNKVMALPLGVQVALVGYRESWLANRDPPSTWPEYLDLVRQQGVAPEWWPTEEAGDRRYAVEFLARAASYAADPGEESALFDLETFEPKLATLAFVRTLDEWIQETNLVREAAKQQSADGGNARVVWTVPPGSEQVLNRSSGPAGSREDSAVGLHRSPFIADGRLVGVATGSRNAASAFKLLAWMGGPEIRDQLGKASGKSLPVRRSQLPGIVEWFKGFVDRVDEASLTEATEAALSQDHCLMIPRIPGVDEYLDELGAAVENALIGKATASEAMSQANAKWEAITNRRGRDAQRRAYLILQR